MAQLPLDPRISRMILEAQAEGCLPEILVIAAALSIQDPRERPADKESQADQAHAQFKDPASDFSSLLGLWQRCYSRSESPQTQNRLRRFCRDHFLSYRRMREWREIHDQILSILIEKKIVPHKDSTLHKRGADLYAALASFHPERLSRPYRPKEGEKHLHGHQRQTGDDFSGIRPLQSGRKLDRRRGDGRNLATLRPDRGEHPKRLARRSGRPSLPAHLFRRPTGKRTGERS